MSYKNIVYVGQFRDSSGYASAARNYVKSFEKVENKFPDINFKIYTVPIEHSSTLSNTEDELLKKYELSGEELEKFLLTDYIMIWHMPATMIMIGQNFVEPEHWNNVTRLLENSSKNINMTVWEATEIPKEWNDKVYSVLGTESVIVPSMWNQQVFSDSLPHNIKCELLPHVIDNPPIDSENKNHNLLDKLKNKFVIFSMSQWQSRKGFDKLIKSYCMEFKDQEDVVLIIKTYGNLMKTNNVSIKEQAQQISNEIKFYKQSVFIPGGKSAKAEIILLPYVLPYEQISHLQTRADLFALLTRAEGFGLTISEAITHETPVLVPDTGGHMDFVDRDNSFLVSGHWSPYEGKPEYNCEMNWYEPHIISARQNMRKAYNMWKDGTLRKVGIKAKKSLEDSGFDYDSVGNSLANIIKNNYTEINPTQLNISENSITQKVLSLKTQVSRLKNNPSKQMEILKDSFKGEDCYILTCGPSIKEYDFDYLREKLSDKLVFTVKQTFDDFGDISNFHFFNSNNFTHFKNTKCISVASSAEFRPIMDNTIWSSQEYDIFLKILEDRDYNNTIARSENFEQWTLDKTTKRPWGPGIMYETVLHFAYHLGVVNIYTLGWDFEEPGTLKSNHYYDKINKKITRPADSMKPQEIADNILASQKFSNWLNSKKVNLFVATEKSFVHEKVERKKI